MLNTKFKFTAHIMKNLSASLILGADFLQTHKFVLDYGSSILKIRDSVVSMRSTQTEQWNKSPDKLMIRKTKVPSSLSLITHENFSRLIEEKKKQNPEIGNIKHSEHNIWLKTKAPITGKIFSIPPSLKSAAEQKVEELLKKGIIQKSSSSFNATAFSVFKRNGKLRLVIDYRCLNKNTIKEVTNIPKIYEQVSDLKVAVIFTCLDLNSRYYQVPMRSRCIPYIAFSLGTEHYEFLRMLFGLYNAPNTFQRAMNTLLVSHKNVKV